MHMHLEPHPSSSLSWTLGATACLRPLLDLAVVLEPGGAMVGGEEVC
jgi:hypothetical protein